MNTTEKLPVLRAVQAPPPFPDATDMPDGKRNMPASSPLPGGAVKPEESKKAPAGVPVKPGTPKGGARFDLPS